MGIKGNFRAKMKECWPKAFEEIFFDELSNKKIAVDIFGLIYSYKNSVMSEDDTWLKMLKENFVKRMKKSIDLIVVFEGKAPAEKLNEQSQRRERRELVKNQITSVQVDLDKFKSGGEMSPLLNDFLNRLERRKRPTAAVYAKLLEDEIIEEMETEESREYLVELLQNQIDKGRKQVDCLSKQDVENVLKACIELQLTIVHAPSEAEQTCAWLCKNGIVDAVWSDDSDLIPLLCPIIIFKHKKTFLKFNLEVLLSESSLTKEQLIDWAILCGTDYNTPIKRVGVVRALEIVKKYNSIENFLNTATDFLTQYNITEETIDLLNFQNARRLFSCQELDTDPYLLEISTQIKRKNV